MYGAGGMNVLSPVEPEIKLGHATAQTLLLNMTEVPVLVIYPNHRTVIRRIVPVSESINSFKNSLLTLSIVSPKKQVILTN